MARIRIRLIVQSIFSKHHHHQQQLFCLQQWCCRNFTVTTNRHCYDYQQHRSSISSISLLGFCTSSVSLPKIHALLIKDGFSHDLFCQTKLVTLYASFGFLSFARFLFDRIPNPDLYSCKLVLRCYLLNHLYFDIIRFYIRMIKCLNEAADNVVFSIVIKACTKLKDLRLGMKVHSHILLTGNPDCFLLTCLIDMYAKCGRIQWSRYVFDNVRDRDVVCWTSMLAGYVQNNCPREGMILFNQMRGGGALVQGNQFTLGSLITACTKLGALHQGKWVHGLIIKNGLDFSSFVVTALVDVYVKCGDIRDARLVFNELCIVDVVSWTAMIAGYTQTGCPHEGLKLFIDKKRQSLLPNSFTAATVLSACGQSENLNMGRSVHGLGVMMGIEDGSVKNALVDMYAKCGKIEDARFIFESNSNKDLIAWNTIITGYSQNGFANKAFELFHLLRLDNLSPDAVTFVTIMSASATLGSLHIGSSIHAFGLKEGLLSSNVYVGTALLNFYAKCGDAKSARVVFDDMGEKNTVTWSAMISGYGIQGDSAVSLSLFDDMVNEKMNPNEAIFTVILSACSHAGMVGEGWRYFNAMCRDYKFVPSMKHYVCMVDLLARSGRLEEARDFIEKMPIQPEASVFGTFLHGCSLHSRFDLAETAVKRMKELHPDEACYYVLMSNLYALEGRWGQADEARRLMRQRHLSKSLGIASLS